MKIIFRSILTFILILTFGCTKDNQANQEILKVGAIPDQNPERLNRLYNLLTKELSNSLNIRIKYIPVTNYPAAVSAFRTGSLDLVWFGGLTGVQARLQTPGSIVLAQRDIDSKFRSVFIANKSQKIGTINQIDELKIFKGKRFTYGSESSTSGRLMPQYFLSLAGVLNRDFQGGQAGFSGSHDATIALVQSGSYDAGALNEQVWDSNITSKNIKTNNIIVIWRTPPYADYHWLARPDLDIRFGAGFTKELQSKLINLNINSKSHSDILRLFGADKFIKANEAQYNKIESIGRKIGKIK